MTVQDGPPAAKRQQILRGAETVFAECGYEGASMSRIALEAGVSKGTLYNYFDSKSKLFAVFVEQKASISLARIFQPANDEEDPVLALNAIALRMIEMMMSPANLILYRIIVSEVGKFPDLGTVFWEAGPAKAVSHMAEWIERQVAKGELDVKDPRFAAEQFLALCQTRIALERRLQIVGESSDAEIEQVVQGAVWLFLRGYGVEPLASAPTKS